MEQSPYPNSDPSILLLNEIDILLAQTRLMELYLKQAQATAANDARHTARVYGTGLFAVGGVALAVATYLLLSGPASHERTAIAPVVSPDQIGIALTGAL